MEEHERSRKKISHMRIIKGPMFLENALKIETDNIQRYDSMGENHQNIIKIRLIEESYLFRILTNIPEILPDRYLCNFRQGIPPDNQNT